MKLQGFKASLDGYHRATLKFGVCYIHKLMFIHHHSCIPSDYEIDHIDRNKSNNSIQNLRCVTVSENRKNRQFKIRTRKNIKSHIMATNSLGNTIFKNISKCSEKIGINVGLISNILNKKPYYYKAISKIDGLTYKFNRVNILP
jgi:hypothetical protein